MNYRLKVILFSALFLILMLSTFYVIYEYKEARETTLNNQTIHEELVPQLRLLEQMRFGILRIVSSTSEHILAGLTYGEGEGEGEGEGDNADPGRRAAEIVEEDEINKGHRVFLEAYRSLGEIHANSREKELITSVELDKIYLHYDRLQRSSTDLIDSMQQEASLSELAEKKEAFEELEQEALHFLAGVLRSVQEQADQKFSSVSLSINQLGNDILFLGAVLIGLMLAYSSFVLQLLRKEAQARASAEVLAEENRREVEERKRIEGLLASHQKLEALGTMLGGIAHSVNNFLTPIIALSKMLKMDYPVGSEVHDDLERIRKSASSASEVLRDVLVFSRTQKRDSNDATEMVACLNRSLSLAKAAMPSSVRFHSEVLPDVAFVSCKEADMEAMILNLVSNAVDALEGDNGDISIRLAEKVITPDLNDLQLARLEPGNYLQLEMTDTGGGISAEDLPNIFDPFFTTKEVGKGSGLGLSVSYSTVKQSGGEIQVSSEVGEYTCFKIYLPVLSEHIKLNRSEAKAV